MGKMLMLLAVSLALGSAAGYLFLTTKIIAGGMQLADGQSRFDMKAPKLDSGRTELEAGKLKLSEGKEEYRRARHNPFLWLVDGLLRGGKSYREARESIAAGDTQVAQGEDDVRTGEGKLDAGKLELSQGAELLRLVKEKRAACALGAVFFASVSVVLGFCCRRSPARIFMRVQGDT